MNHAQEYEKYTKELLPAINKMMTDKKYPEVVAFIKNAMDQAKDEELLPSMLGKQLSLAWLTQNKTPEATATAQTAYERLGQKHLSYNTADEATAFALAETSNMLSECWDRGGHRPDAIAQDLKNAEELTAWRARTPASTPDAPVPNGEVLAMFHNNLSRMLKGQDIKEAEAHAELSLTIRQAEKPPNLYFTSTNYKNLGDIRVEKAKLLPEGESRTLLLKVAEADLNDSYVTRQKLFSANHPKIAELEESIAYLDAAKGNRAEAFLHAAAASKMLGGEGSDAGKQLAKRLATQGIVLASTESPAVVQPTGGKAASPEQTPVQK